MVTIKIYKLINPFDNSIFYVGKTVNSLEKRLHAHMKDKGTNKRKKETIENIIKNGALPLIELIESHTYNNDDEEYNALLREDFWRREYSKSYDLCNGSAIIKPRLLKDYSQISRKTKTHGVRFDIEDFEFIKRNQNLETAQQVVYFLMNEYMKLFKSPKIGSDINR